jgi:hypothetical protein
MDAHFQCVQAEYRLTDLSDMDGCMDDARFRVTPTRNDVKSRAGPRLQRCPTTTRKLHIVRAEKQETKPRSDPKPEKPEDDEPKSDGPPSLKKDLAKMTTAERKDIEEAMTALKAQGFDSAVAQKVRLPLPCITC